MRATLIFNPAAGSAMQFTLGQVVALMNEAGYRVRVQSTADKGWQSALKKPADFIAVAGGDGTVAKVARRLIGTGLPLAVLPMGTANNISKTLGISAMPITRLIPSWKSARRLKFDAGVASGPWGKRYFIEGVGAGLLSTSIPKVERSKTLPQLKDTAVKVTYAQQLFRENLWDCPAISIEATLDGKDISGNYLLLEILNMQYVGPNLFLAPEVLPDNGEFDVILIAEEHRNKLHTHIKRWQEGKEQPPNFHVHRGKHLALWWTGFGLHIDGKVWPAPKGRKPKPPALIEFNVEPEAVEFLIPEEIHQEQKLIRKNRLKAQSKPKRVK